MVSVTMKELLEAGVHFGHQTKRWNPKMKEYIFGQRNGIYIIDLQKTIRVFKDALQFIKSVAESGKEVLMVGTKKQAQDIIRDLSLKCESSYVNQRWLGGLLTNFNVIRGSVERLIELDEMKEDGRWGLLSKKEQSKLEKVYRKLSKNLGGIKNMLELPGALFVIDSTKEEIAIYEARKLNIPIVAVVDTNGDPENIDHPIPGNDDAVRAIELFTSKISEAIIEGKKERMERELLKAKKEEEVSPEEEGAPKEDEIVPPPEAEVPQEEEGAPKEDEEVAPVEEEIPQEEEVSQEEGKATPSEEKATSRSKSSDEEEKDESFNEPEKGA
ncbi:MAG: 30S ribosomal protein S2 [Candidatus Aminicenantes bacterium]|nr:30S ribosomal protein S2 [Candidatus Aminicenantes bacterium]